MREVEAKNFKGSVLKEGRYKCRNGHRFNVRSSFKLPAKTYCRNCGAKSERMAKRPRYTVLLMENASGGTWHGFSTKKHAQAWYYSKPNPISKMLFQIRNKKDMLLLQSWSRNKFKKLLRRVV